MRGGIILVWIGEGDVGGGVEFSVALVLTVRAESLIGRMGGRAGARS